MIVQHYEHWFSSRGCRFDSLHLHVSQQPSTTPVSGDPIPSSGLQRQHTSGYTETHMQTNIHLHKVNKNRCLKKGRRYSREYLVII